MSIAQLFLQLGISGAMLFVWWQIESKRIDRNATVEDNKTKALAEGFKSLAELVTDHAVADHQQHAKQIDRLAAIETALDIRIKTPPQGVSVRETHRAGTRDGNR